MYQRKDTSKNSKNTKIEKCIRGKIPQKTQKNVEGVVPR
jgi:hypothetical protein